MVNQRASVTMKAQVARIARVWLRAVALSELSMRVPSPMIARMIRQKMFSSL